MCANVYAHLQQTGAIVTIPALAIDAADTPSCTTIMMPGVAIAVLLI